MSRFYSMLALILVLFLTSLFIMIFQPRMHNQIFVYDYKFQLVENDTKQVTTQNLPTVAAKPKTVKTVNSIPKIVEKRDTVVKNTKQVKAGQKKTNTTSRKAPVSRQVTTQAPIKSVETKTVKAAQDKVKQVQQKEEVLWNNWRSNIQNSIMGDVKLPLLPTGTIFRFSFDVDKFGRVSNIKTWSESPECTPYAIQYIAPVIRSYQGRSILNFPGGSQRFTTNVEGGWKVSDVKKLSHPDDYNDIEQIRN